MVPFSKNVKFPQSTPFLSFTFRLKFLLNEKSRARVKKKRQEKKFPFHYVSLSNKFSNKFYLYIYIYIQKNFPLLFFPFFY